MRILVVGIALAACGTSAPAPPGASGPVYTPGIHLELTNFAPECTVTKGEAGKAYACVGRFGTAAIALGAGDRLRHIEVKLRPMLFPIAKAHVEPALRPLLGQAGVDAVDAQLEKLHQGSAALELAGAHVAISAVAGADPEVREYTITLDW